MMWTFAYLFGCVILVVLVEETWLVIEQSAIEMNRNYFLPLLSKI